MSLIIEDKNALDSLANAIIGANGSVDKTSATKGELTDIVNGIIPLKSKFASGVFTPSENITSNSKVWIDFAIGKDNDEILTTPDLIIIYQPYSLNYNGKIEAVMLTVMTYNGIQYKPDTQPDFLGFVFSSYRTATPKSETSPSYAGGTLNNFKAVLETENPSFMIKDKSFNLAPVGSRAFLAGHPIIWLQIKF